MKPKADKTEQILEGSLRLFSQKGFFATTMPDIARFLSMSPGNIYNYFASKEELAKAVITYSSKILGEEVRKINEMSVDSEEKIWRIVAIYFSMVKDRPEHIDYFLKVYLANKEIFSSSMKELLYESVFIQELRTMFEEGVLKRELRNQDFFSVLGILVGTMAGVAFMFSEDLLENDIMHYTKSISENIYEALRLK
ncbi:TetR/AcrR family transcriptional regulator [Sulfurospirillum sp. T05]|uniref:TetR/AcrR family transcriptional regulator n=1 Tax=Sulfurospirillum tamanense TaxID=2813362 RepID=A0ABS2WQ53_9BACT|nr:TetR/AcrR family transcriptional regulator [Sulfurospirillum tamanensis]